MIDSNTDPAQTYLTPEGDLSPNSDHKLGDSPIETPQDSIENLAREAVSAIEGFDSYDGQDSEDSYKAYLRNKFSSAVDGILTDNSLDDQERRRKITGLRDILAHGMLTGKRVDGAIGNESDHSTNNNRQRRRTKMAEIFLKNPQAATALAETQTFAFHASTSGSLLDIAEHGLAPGQELKGKGINPRTGEWDFQKPAGQGSISGAEFDDTTKLAFYAGSGKPIKMEDLESNIQFTEDLVKDRLARGSQGGVVLTSTLQATLERNKALAASLRDDPTDPKNRLYLENIPILWGLSNEIAQVQPMEHMSGEIRIEGVVAPDKLRVVAVPESKMGYVAEILKSKGLNPIIIAMEDLLHAQDRFIKREFIEGQGLIDMPYS